MDMRELWGASQKAPPKRGAITVSQLNQRIKTLLERQHPQVTVVGELSAPKLSGGHAYFKLKDGGAVVSAVMFRQQLAKVGFRLEHGLQVRIEGRVTLYAPSGQYQIVAESMALQGQGALQQSFEALKAKLKEEGLFDAERKRELPRFPRRVSVVTSLQGAVLRDIIDVARRRWPAAQLLLSPVRVQGQECARSVCLALDQIRDYRERHDVEVVIIARGGGSFEDLFPFSDEQLARKVADFPIPVVSAIGHETDYSICDFVSDVRAPTPSAAAEIVFPSQDEVHGQISQYQNRSTLVIQRKLNNLRHVQRQANQVLTRFRNRIRDDREELLRWESEIYQQVHARIQSLRSLIVSATQRIDRLHPGRRLEVLKTREALLSQRRNDAIKRLVELKRSELSAAMVRLDALSPLSVLDRGYSVVTHGQRVVSSVSELKKGSTIAVRFKDGIAEAQITDVAKSDLEERPDDG